MKQILLTIGPTSRIPKQMEVRDFLDVCDHSPEWIGKVEDWEIRSFYTYDNEKGQQVVTALLENKVWKEPSVTALTAKQIYDSVKDADPATKVSLGIRKGLKVYNIESYNFGEINSFTNSNGYCVLTPLKQNNNPQITVQDLSYIMNDSYVKVIIQSEICGTTGYPITEVTSHDGNIVLIYNQDVIIG